MAKLKNTSLNDGFNALGKNVPGDRLMSGYKTVKEMCPNLSSETAYHIVAKCANYIERDEPFFIVGATNLDEDLAKIDLTGRYRLLATLLTD